jgi:hypothetical protein
MDERVAIGPIDFAYYPELGHKTYTIFIGVWFRGNVTTEVEQKSFRLQ